MVRNNGLDPKEAKDIYDSYMKGFPGVKKYQDYCRMAVIRDGYILMNPVTKHRAHIEGWETRWKKLRDFSQSPTYWQDYQRLKEERSPDVYWINQWKTLKSDLEKASINYRIQNRGAMSTKLAGILFFNWIIKNNLQNKVKICLQIHDKYLL